MKLTIGSCFSHLFHLIEVNMAKNWTLIRWMFLWESELTLSELLSLTLFTALVLNTFHCRTIRTCTAKTDRVYENVWLTWFRFAPRVTQSPFHTKYPVLVLIIFGNVCTNIDSLHRARLLRLSTYRLPQNGLLSSYVTNRNLQHTRWRRNFSEYFLVFHNNWLNLLRNSTRKSWSSSRFFR